MWCGRKLRGYWDPNPNRYFLFHFHFKLQNTVSSNCIIHSPTEYNFFALWVSFFVTLYFMILLSFIFYFYLSLLLMWLSLLTSVTTPIFGLTRMYVFSIIFIYFFHLIQQNSVLSRSFPITKAETIIWCCTKLRTILHMMGILSEYAHIKRKISTYVDILDKWDSFWCAFRVMWQKIARLLRGLRESNNWWF